MNRRKFLRIGLAGFGSLSLPGLMRLRTAAAAPTSERTAVILVWLRGGASHLDTLDPKPSAPADYRGPFDPIATRTPGLFVSELLPRHARLSDKFAVLRSMAHTGGGHPAGSWQLLAGDTDVQDKLKPVYPDFMSVTGEFGRTPRISYVASSGGGVASAAAGTVQPGRDHWPNANSMIWAGGGIQTGQVIGGTDRRGEEVVSRRVGPQDFLATIYRHLGIDAEKVAIPDFSGRPIAIVNGGQPIVELGAVS